MKSNRTYSINVRGRLFSLARPVVMGIVNATPDSFYAASRTQTEREIADRARQIVEEGGQIIDIGGFSTRPDAQTVSVEEELSRLEFAIQTVHREVPDVPISVDTFRPDVAQRCIEEWGADMVNDVGSIAMASVTDADRDRKERMFTLVARLGVPYILMSRASTIEEIMLELAADVNRLCELGQKDIVLDPGFGFGKTQQQNYDILNRMALLTEFDFPLLVGLSRKSMLRLTPSPSDSEQLNATTALHMAALERGANVLRVHDVAQAVQTVRLFEMLKTSESIANE